MEKKDLFGWEPVDKEPDRKEYVYLIGADLIDGKQIKIGRSYHPEKRRYQILFSLAPKVELLSTIPVIGSKNASSLERYLHDHFLVDRLNGEWFSPSNEILEFISKIGLNHE